MHRARLDRHGFSRAVVYPQPPENFGAVMDAGLRRYGLGLLRGMTRESASVDLGYVDGARLAVACREAARGRADLDRSWFQPLALELAFRSFG